METLAARNVENEFAVLVWEHGPFMRKRTPQKAVEKALVMEQVAMMAWRCCAGKSDVGVMSPVLLKKHFGRKHGKNTYYGQDNA